ncbi:hypothetical protein BJY04DRAFT_215372 [Aspergillus karnatakaensis]|uniref:uncharacterized protein n=1 Tax=Aspergillus karnatakaensis TaxID=1810916 RepID=UPI003CCE2809
MPISWDDQKDAKLLMGIITISGAKCDWKAVSAYMGPEVTPIAVQRRFQRLKEKAASDPTPATTDGNSNGSKVSNDTASDAGASVATGLKRKRGRPAKNANTAGSAVENEEDGGPSKVAKGANGTANGAATATTKGNGAGKGKGNGKGRGKGKGKGKGKAKPEAEAESAEDVKMKDEEYEEQAADAADSGTTADIKGVAGATADEDTTANGDVKMKDTTSAGEEEEEAVC